MFKTKTCAILHNMLIVYDGLDVLEWNTNWEVEDPNMADENIVSVSIYIRIIPTLFVVCFIFFFNLLI